MGLLPDEAKVLPPPGIINRNSLWFGFMGWCTAIIQNNINRRSALRAGLHRQLLFTTVGWFLGYHLTKFENYTRARVDREMLEYVRHHPEDFPGKDQRTLAEILEDFHPIR
ncbi:hypothetical protein AGOR_G00125810 [Albula goreensis]|uniref:NADH dehydrogenase [ubiquinone] 1 subunit C2 n=1 Tax=Albula goreensis TaxID=1534307 RepID=A0A8T3DC12_9TELE|nr:hypothetical protein AGOR_G00125810 [Albula goreensis]